MVNSCLVNVFVVCRCIEAAWANGLWAHGVVSVRVDFTFFNEYKSSDGGQQCGSGVSILAGTGGAVRQSNGGTDRIMIKWGKNRRGVGDRN